jgi:murein DD-endopeptidase MepM/ murein hydrolase activator NlpD
MTKTLKDYPISFPYGVTTDPYSPSHPHRGDDRAAPVNTPIVVEGAIIGYVGMTGFADGYHCHNQEWQGTKTNVRKPQNAFKGGVVIEVDSIGNTGDGSWGKYVTVKNADGWNSSYCHMNKTNAKVGQVLKGGDMTTNRGDAIWLYRTLLGIHSPTEKQKQDWTGRNLSELLEAISKDKRYLAFINKGYQPYNGDPLYVKA